MRLRVKFTKTGSMSYISHLDIMRYFQKALRRVEADVSLSEGFSPHMQMSFALPLSLGMESLGEYFDVDMKSCGPTEDLKNDLNEQMCGEIRVVSIKSIPQDKANKCMSQVAAADYSADLKKQSGEPYLTEEKAAEEIKRYMDQPQIIVLKKTKRHEEEADIKPFIYSFERKGEKYRMRLRAGSVNHIKCEAVIRSFVDFTGGEYDALQCEMCRDDLLLETENGFLPLDSIGEEIV